jgi:hypothetical protein
MDISELRGFVVVLFVLSACVGVFVLAKRIGRKWLRWPLRGTAIVGATLTLFVLALFIFGEYACTARVPVAYSPDGKHAAILTWGLQGALGMDIANVAVRYRYNPFAKNVYSGPGISPIPHSSDIDPQIRWIDNTHLLIRYHDYPEYDQTCASGAFDVEVICEHSPWPSAQDSQQQK